MSRPVEIWLRSNRRAMLAGAVAPLLLVALGLAVALDVFVAAPVVARVFAGVLALLGAVLLAVLVWYGSQPRLAYDGRNLLVFLRSGRPVPVPIEWVECFLLSSGLRELPGHRGREVQISQLSVRLAERASQWAEMEVKPALGKWCGGYITIYGAWSEPLNMGVVRQLNARLAAAHEAERNRAPIESLLLF